MAPAIIAGLLITGFVCMCISFLVSLTRYSLQDKEKHSGSSRNPTYVFIPLKSFTKTDYIRIVFMLTGATGLIGIFVHLHTGKTIDPGFIVLTLSGISALVIAGVTGFSLAYLRLVRK